MATIQVSNNELQVAKRWVMDKLRLGSLSKFIQKCKDIECIGGTKRFVFFDLEYDYVPPKYRNINSTTTFVEGTDILAENYYKSEWFNEYINKLIAGFDIKGTLQIYTRRKWFTNVHGRNIQHPSRKEVVMIWTYEGDPQFRYIRKMYPPESICSTIEKEEYECTCGEKQGVCESCGETTIRNYGFEM